MDTFQSLGAPSRSRFGVFKLSKPKRLRARHGLPNRISEGSFVYRAISELDVDAAWGTWLGEQRGAHGELRPVLLKHTGDGNRTRAGADALWLEALLTSKLEGPQVVPLVDYGVVDGRPFAVYDFEEGVFLAQVLEGLRERNIQLPSSVAVGIVLQACDLVGRLHELRLDDEEGEGVGGFIHGSLCPRNFVLTGRGDVRVMGLVGVRPVGRVVGREHVPAAALEYASPDLLGGAPVTPAVDVYSLGAVLAELLGPEPLPGDELGRLVREILAGTNAKQFSTVRGLAGALQEAVRRTGTVVARQSIASQVREICEQYLLERHKQVRALLDTEWPDKRDASAPESGVAPAKPVSVPAANSLQAAAAEWTGGIPSSVPAQTSLAGLEKPVVPQRLGPGSSPEHSDFENSDFEHSGPGSAPGIEVTGLGQYDEDADDAVTRFMDDVEVGAEASGQAPAWMNDNAPSDLVSGGFSKRAIGGLMGVLIAIGSVAAIVAFSAPEAPYSEALSPESQSAEAASAKVAAVQEIAASEEKLAALAVDSLPEAPAGAAKVSRSLPSVTPPERNVAQEPSEAVNSDRTASDKTDSEDVVASGKPIRSAKSKAAGKRRAKARRKARRKPAAKRSAGKNSQYDPMAVELPDTVATSPSGKKTRAIAIADEPAEIVREMAAENDIEYEEAPKMAFLSVDASPYANVFIDGKKVGVTPIVSLELAPGPHRMVAKNADGETKRYTLMLEAGQTETVKIAW